MGGVPSNMWATWTNRENQPDRHNDPTFDPLLGFPEGRKKRVMKISHEELEAACVPHKYRDYCAHLYVDLIKCRKNHGFSRTDRCKHEAHVYGECQHEDWILRMKEYEREKRLIRKRNAKLKEMM